MKKWSFMTAMVLCVLVLAGCRQEEVMHHGLNAEVVAVDAERGTIRVKDPGKEELFGPDCLLDCGTAVESRQVLYCNYESGEVWEIALEELQEGDEITLGMSETELAKLKDGKACVSQIQLGTQRLNG